MDTVHQSAKLGFVDGDNYDANRPSYTNEAVELIASVIQNQQFTEAEYDCVEVGAGTGKFTKMITNQLPKTTKYLATEPSDGFLAKLHQMCPAVKTLQCPADNIPLPDSSVKNIVGAQCFHWFANDKALTELHRVLVPGGKLIFIWNKKNLSTPWVSELDKIVTEKYDGTPRYASLKWKEVMENFPKFKLFDAKYLSGVDMKGTKQHTVQTFGSISVIARLNDVDKQDVLQRMRSVLETHQDTKDLDIIQIPYTTDIHIYSKV